MKAMWLPKWLPWALMGIALAAALAVGIADADDPPTAAERATALARTIRCPQCQGETAAESNVAIAAAIRADIRERVDQGQSDAEIRQVYADLYGDSVLLTPPGEGFGSVLWVIPIVAVVVGAAVLGIAWRQRVLRQRELGQAAVGKGEAQAAGGAVAGGVVTSGAAAGVAAAGETPEGKAIRKPSRPNSRRWSVIATVAVALVAAVVAGVLLARTVGFRSSTDEATGDIRQTSRGLIVRAGELAGQRDYEAAIDVYDEVLSSEPSNVVALTYKGWLTWLNAESDTVAEQASGDGSSVAADGENSSGASSSEADSTESSSAGSEAVSPEENAAEDRSIILESERLLTEAIALDPDYPDARVFRTIIFASTSRWRLAQADLAVFDSLNPAADLRGLVDNSNLRADIDAGMAQEAVTATLELVSGATEPLTEEEVAEALQEFTDPQLNAAGLSLITPGQVLAAERVQAAATVFTHLLARNPDNLAALTGRGYLFTLPDFIESTEVFSRGLADLDRAVQLAPDNSSVRLLRAQALVNSAQHPDEARADLDAIDASNPSEDLQSAANTLRERLDEAPSQAEE